MIQCPSEKYSDEKHRKPVEKHEISSLTDALSDIRRSMAGIGETQSEGAIDFKAKIRVILVLDKNTEALLTLLHHLLEPTAAINGRRFGIATNIRQARGKADELV